MKINGLYVILNFIGFAPGQFGQLNLNEYISGTFNNNLIIFLYQNYYDGEK
jgi:hypothetical protein